MFACTKCNQPESVMKAGFVRGRQRFFLQGLRHFTESKPAVPERKRYQATLADVACAVGVASSTVSRALNGHVDIRSVTRPALGFFEKARLPYLAPYKSSPCANLFFL